MFQTGKQFSLKHCTQYGYFFASLQIALHMSGCLLLIYVFLANTAISFKKLHVKKSKFTSFVDQVGLLYANQNYVHVRYPDGRENVSFRDWAPGAQGQNP